MKQLSMTYWYGNKSTIFDRVSYIKNSGFKKISLHWCDEYTFANGFKTDILEVCKMNKISIDVFHLPFEEVDYLWDDTLEGEKVFEIYKDCIIDASKYKVKYVVMHLTQNKKSISDDSVGKQRILKLIQIANKLNVTIAFENLQHYDALELIEEMLDYKCVTLCYDLGHYNIMKNRIIDKHLDKISVIHLHNNFGKEDSHEMLKIGNCKWKYLKEILKINKNVEIVLEVKNNEKINEKIFLSEVYNDTIDLLEGENY